MGRQRIFPELDLYVATNACVGHDVEVPWFLMDGTGSSGMELSEEAGAVCGAGLECFGEMVSQPKRRVSLPVSTFSNGFHRMEPYGLEIFGPCEFRPNSSCFCGVVECTREIVPDQACCRDGSDIEWRKVGALAAASFGWP